jgi:hypothetical protein
MEREKIKELLAKYFEGETSEEEEIRLKELIQSSSPEDPFLTEYRYIAMQPGTVPEPSEAFEAGLEELTHREFSIRPALRSWRWLSGISAAIAFITGLWLIFSNINDRQRDTFNDPLIAMAEVKSVLLTISERMNTGTAQLELVGTITDKPDELKGLTTIGDVVSRSLTRLRYLDELNPRANDAETTIKK